MPSSLKSRLNDLASSFAAAVLDAIKGASLQELLAEEGAARSPGRPRAAAAVNAGRPSRTTRSGRLKRRSAADIAKLLDRIVALVKTRKAGLRAEQIRAELGLQAKEMPRVLKDGLSKKKLKARGQKRATTYFAA